MKDPTVPGVVRRAGQEPSGWTGGPLRNARHAVEAGAGAVGQCAFCAGDVLDDGLLCGECRSWSADAEGRAL